MKKLVILSIVTILLLSGCTENVDDKGDNQSSVDNSSLVKNDTSRDVVNETGTETGKINISEEDFEASATGGSETSVTVSRDSWCESGAKISENGKEYEVLGITTYGDKENVCKAERPNQGGSAVIYFNKEYVSKESGAFFAENVTSSGPNAHSEAKVSVVITSTGK